MVQYCTPLNSRHNYRNFNDWQFHSIILVWLKKLSKSCYLVELKQALYFLSVLEGFKTNNKKPSVKLCYLCCDINNDLR